MRLIVTRGWVRARQGEALWTVEIGANIYGVVQVPRDVALAATFPLVEGQRIVLGWEWSPEHACLRAVWLRLLYMPTVEAQALYEAYARALASYLDRHHGCDNV